MEVDPLACLQYQATVLVRTSSKSYEKFYEMIRRALVIVPGNKKAAGFFWLSPSGNNQPCK